MQSPDGVEVKWSKGKARAEGDMMAEMKIGGEMEGLELGIQGAEESLAVLMMCMSEDLYFEGSSI